MRDERQFDGIKCRCRYWAVSLILVVSLAEGRLMAQEAAALDPKKMVLPEKVSELARTARIQLSWRQFGEAEATLSEAFAVGVAAVGIDKDPMLASIGHDLGNLRISQERYADALIPLEYARSVRDGGENPAEALLTLNSLACAYGFTGREHEADRLFRECLRRCREDPEGTKPALATVLNNASMFYEEIGQLSRAVDYLRQALELVRDPAKRAASLSNLAGLRRSQASHIENQEERAKILREALRVYEEVRAIENRIFTTTAHAKAITMNNRGGCQQELGEHEAARKSLEEALGMIDENNDDHVVLRARILNNLGSALHALGRREDAAGMLRRSLEIRSAELGDSSEATARALENLAGILLDSGEETEAARLARRGALVRAAILERMLLGGSRRGRLQFRADQDDSYGLLAKTGQVSLLAELVIRQKNAVVDSLAEDRRLAHLIATERPEVVAKLNREASIRGKLFRLALEGGPDADEQRDALATELESLETELRLIFPHLAGARRASTLRLQELQSCLAPRTALVEFVRYGAYMGAARWEPRYGALVITSGDEPRWVSIDTPVSLVDEARKKVGVEDRINICRSSAAGGFDPELEKELWELYRIVWEPVEEFLDGMDTVVICPDASLNFVPFAALPTAGGGDGKLLCEKYKVRYVSAGRDLIRPAGKPQRVDLATITNPDYGEGNGRRPSPKEDRAGATLLQGKRFAGLPGTEALAVKLHERAKGWGWRSSSSYSKGLATELTLRTLRSPSILHIGTHGFFEAARGKVAAFNDPMRRSGLALSGANRTLASWEGGEEIPDPQSDGVLLADEVPVMDLQETWVVTISACRSGLGEASAGEGVAGLRRGFAIAGAGHLVMTLWEVQDREAAEFLLAFYEELSASGDPGAALCNVQKKLLVRGRAEGKFPEAVKHYGAYVATALGR